MMKTLSPKQVARALEVSESSLKRWCDQGLLASSKTGGGHRRLAVESVLRFVQESGRRLVHPELLGLPARSGTGQRTLLAAREDLVGALLAGDEVRCRQILFDAHLSGIRLSRIFDELAAPAFERIGQAWACGEAQVYQERRALEACLRVLFEMREALPAPAAEAPLAIGGTPVSDPYSLPTTMVELTLRQGGWAAHSLGTHLPLDTLEAAIEQMQPRLFWLSVSYLDNEADFVRTYATFYERVRARVLVVVGGQALTDRLRRQMQYAAFCDNLQHLEGFAAAAWPAPPARRVKKSGPVAAK